MRNTSDNRIVEKSAQFYREEATRHRLLMNQMWATFFRTGFIMVAGAFTVVFLSAAWFANNTTVRSSDTRIVLEAPPGLIISTAEKISIATISDQILEFEDPAAILYAATHNPEGSGVVSASNLVYNTNPGIISSGTGYPFGGKHISYAAAENTDSNLFFRDYDVCIASVNDSIEIQELSARLAIEGEMEQLEDTYCCASIDFYVNDEYKGTLNLANQDYLNESEDPVESVVLIGEAYTVPCNTDSFIPVKMRLYFDGNLTKEDGQAYLYSDQLSTEELSLEVYFEAK